MIDLSIILIFYCIGIKKNKKEKKKTESESENHTDNMQLAEAEISAKRTSEALSVADYATG